MSALSVRASARIDPIFSGETSIWIYPALRIALALIVLVRHTDWLEPLFALEHHTWVDGLDHRWSIESEPRLRSPLISGLDLGRVLNDALVYARLGLAVLLLLGVRSRVAAALLAAVGLTLLCTDRYRYFHHLFFLYSSLAWLAFAPLNQRWSLEAALRPTRSADSAPLWPLQLLRASVIGVYFATGIAKLDPEWLGGHTLDAMERFHILRGSSWSVVRSVLATGTLAKLICGAELLIAGALIWRRARLVAVVAALMLHLSIEAMMPVSTFGLQMLVALLVFLPKPSGSRPTGES